MGNSHNLMGNSTNKGLLCFAATHGDIAVRLDLVDPEALLHQAAGSAQQLFELAQREGPHLRGRAGLALSQIHGVSHDMTAHHRSKTLQKVA